MVKKKHEINTEAEGKIMKLKNKKNENENKESCENLCNLVVRKRKMLKDERGQLSIDFLVGISLFILALLFMAHFIPGMFVPFQTETIDLNSVAYRTSVILVEDPGWWDNESGPDWGEDWENQSIEEVRRVGLAIDKEHPNMLPNKFDNMSKTKSFKNKTQINDATLTRKLGLYRIIGDNPIDYGYNITIVDSDKNILAARGEIPPEYGDVVSMKRIVSVNRTGYGYLLEGNISGSDKPTKALIKINSSNVYNFTREDLTFKITNFNLTEAGSMYQGTKVSHNVKSNASVGLKLDAPKTLSGISDGYVSVNYSTPKYKINTNMDINSQKDLLIVTIKTAAWANNGINTTGVADIFIEIQVSKIKVEKVHDEANMTELQATDEFIQDPSNVIVKIWT